MVKNTDYDIQQSNTQQPNIQSSQKISPQEAQKKLLAMQEKMIKELKIRFDRTEKDSKKFVEGIAKKYKKELLGIVIVPPKPQAQKSPGFPTSEKPSSSNPELFVILDIKKGKNLMEQVKTATPIFKDIIERSKSSLKDTRVNPILLDEVWDACLKGHYDVIKLICSGRIIKDGGWLTALKSVELHKNIVLSKLDKYVVSYIIVGSIIRGDVDPSSDLDVYIIIDDTDVTRMTSAELRQRLMAMINNMVFEVEDKLKTKYKVHPQVHVLTDVWNSIKNANPVVFTFLRDGIPLYDRGMFTPWRLLLKKGKVSPTPEAIDNYLKSGRIILEKVKLKMREIAMEDFHWATSTPTNGLLMLMGIPPVAPKEIGAKLREHLVKPGLLEEKYVKIWDELLKLRKDIEHGKIKEVDPKTVADYNNKAKIYIDRLEKLFTQIEKKKVREVVQDLHEKTIDDARSALKIIGSKAEKKNVLSAVKNELVTKKFATKRYLSLIEKVIKMSKTFDTSRQEVSSLEFEQDRLSKETFERINAEKGRNVSKYKINAKYASGKKTASIWLFGDEAYILEDASKTGAVIKKYKITKKGALQEPNPSSLKIIEKKLATFSGKPAELNENTLKSLRSILAGDVKLVFG